MNRKIKIKIEYEIHTSIGLVEELDDKIRVFFSSLGFKDKGSGSGFGFRDMQFEREEKTMEIGTND